MSRDGRYVVSCSWDRQVKAWNTASGELVGSVHYAQADLSTVVSTLQMNQVFVAAEDGFVGCWRVPDGEELEAVAADPNVVMALSCTPRAERLAWGAVGGEMSVQKHGRSVAAHTVRGHDADIRAMAMDPGGRFVLSGGVDKCVLLWDLDKLEIDRAFNGHSDAISAVCIRQDAKLGASASWDGTVRFWYLASGTGGGKLDFKSQVWGIASTPDLRIMVVGEKSGAVTLLDM